MVDIVCGVWCTAHCESMTNTLSTLLGTFGGIDFRRMREFPFMNEELFSNWVENVRINFGDCLEQAFIVIGNRARRV